MKIIKFLTWSCITIFLLGFYGLVFIPILKNDLELFRIWLCLEHSIFGWILFLLACKKITELFDNLEKNK